MTIWVLVAAAAILASEAILRLPLLPQIRTVGDTARRSTHVLRSARISDHWKERMLPVYSVRLARASILFFAMLCAALVPVILVGFAYNGGLAGWLDALMRPAVIAVLCLVSLGWLGLRTRRSGG